jgi:asparagine synthase (glutamine-hydrolysing)
VFAGGRPLRHRLDSPAAVAELDRVVRAEAAANFTRRRLVPHFYHALLGARAEHLIHVFQTAAFWTIAETLAPQALFGVRDGRPVDKLCLRLACESLLDPPARQLAWTAKDPIQRSTGLMSVLAAAAREHAATLPGARTYSDPRGEPFETIATRLYLALLAARVNPPTERRVHRD